MYQKVDILFLESLILGYFEKILMKFDLGLFDIFHSFIELIKSLQENPISYSF